MLDTAKESDVPDFVVLPLDNASEPIVSVLLLLSPSELLFEKSLELILVSSVVSVPALLLLLLLLFSLFLSSIYASGLDGAFNIVPVLPKVRFNFSRSCSCVIGGLAGAPSFAAINAASASISLINSSISACSSGVNGLLVAFAAAILLRCGKCSDNQLLLMGNPTSASILSSSSSKLDVVTSKEPVSVVAPFTALTITVYLVESSNSSNVTVLLSSNVVAVPTTSEPLPFLVPVLSLTSYFTPSIFLQLAVIVLFVCDSVIIGLIELAGGAGGGGGSTNSDAAPDAVPDAVPDAAPDAVPDAVPDDLFEAFFLFFLLAGEGGIYLLNSDRLLGLNVIQTFIEPSPILSNLTSGCSSLEIFEVVFLSPGCNLDNKLSARLCTILRTGSQLTNIASGLSLLHLPSYRA